MSSTLMQNAKALKLNFNGKFYDKNLFSTKRSFWCGGQKSKSVVFLPVL